LTHKSTNAFKAKFETLTRKKTSDEEIAEVDIMTENLRYLDLTPQAKKSFTAFEPEECNLMEGETRSYLDPRETSVRGLMTGLKEWINSRLAGIQTRVSIDSFEEDLKDGMVFKLLLERELGEEIKLPCGDFVQSKERQLLNVEYIINHFSELQGKTFEVSAKGILSGELYPTLLFLIKIAKYCHSDTSPYLPKVVKITLLKMRKKNGNLERGEKQVINIMGPSDDWKRDGFDTLIDHAPEKLHFVTQSLLKFTNAHLSKVGYPVDDLENDFSDGVRLILLLGLLEGYFVPLHNFKLHPENVEDKIENMNYAFKLLDEVGLSQSRNGPCDIVHNDLKSTLRIIYSLFIKYKN